jgi:hypothetical protein
MSGSPAVAADEHQLVRWPVGLLLLALANLVAASAVLVAIPQTVRDFFFPILQFNIAVVAVATWRGQALILGMVAGLLPRRAIAGLLAVILYAVLNGYGLGYIAAIRRDESGIESTAFWFGIWAMAVQIAFRIARLCDGWQLSREPPTATKAPRQFEIIDLLELTTAVAVALGLFVAVRGREFTSQTVSSFCLVMGQLLLVGLPVALTILAIPNPSRRTILGVFVWCIAAELTIRLIWDWFGRGAIRARIPPEYTLYLPTYWGVIAANSFVLRRLGYRCWRR